MMKALMAGTLLSAFLVFPLTGCGSEDAATPEVSQADLEDVVRTTFYPTTYFARRIAGGEVPVECLVPEDEDPIFWDPSREVLASYMSAKLVVVNGAKFEKWVARASLPKSRMVDTAESFKDRFVKYDLGITHSHGPGGEHSHEGTDGHTWVDPKNAIDQSLAIADAMARAWPEKADTFEANLPGLVSDLESLHTRFTEEITPSLEGVKLLASHPAYNYLESRYGWEITDLDLDPDEGLTDEAIAEINEGIGDFEGAVVLLWESEPSIDPEIEYPFKNVTFSPAELPFTGAAIASPDYIGIMNANIDRLRDALAE